jgi:hypothetical protein
MTPRLRFRRATLAAICAWLVTLGALLARPPASLEAASGLYGPQARDGRTYRWSGSDISIPTADTSGPTIISLDLGPSRWAGRAAPYLVLRDKSGELARLTGPDTLRQYHLLLPPGNSALTIHSTVDRPPGREPRWLGFTLYGLSAQPSGLPVGALSLALALLPAYLALALAFAWGAGRGLGPPMLLFGLALALRTLQLNLSPPGWRVDELVSLVDAWSLAHTGRDHLGNLLPLGAFEALGDWISPLLTYLELPFVAIFGPQRLVGRLVTASVGALAAPLGYGLGRAVGLRRPGALAVGLAMALSPWQIFMSRVALPPATVPTFVTTLLLAGAIFIRRGGRRASLGLSLAAGVALYAYPTLKLAAPLLVALIVGIALWERRRASAQTGRAHEAPVSPGALIPAGLLLALLWAPFAYVTLFNPASATRLGQAALRASSWGAWLSAWWAGYRVYFWPDFYYRFGDGSSIRGVPGFGVELWATLPLLVLGLASLALSALRIGRPTTDTRRPGFVAPYLLGALLIAALPASFTMPSPHSYRAALLAPLYALIVGVGFDWLWGQIGRLAGPTTRRPTRWLAAGALGVALLWQGALWWRAYTESYPQLQAALNQDGLSETVRRAVAIAPGYDEVWVSYDSIDQPYLYVLAAQPLPASEAQRQIVVERRPGRFNAVTSVGHYRFIDTSGLPARLPTLEAVPGAAGGPGYVVQELRQGGKHILVVRGM